MYTTRCEVEDACWFFKIGLCRYSTFRIVFHLCGHRTELLSQKKGFADERKAPSQNTVETTHAPVA